MIVISAGMQKAASASYFNLANGLLMAAGYEDVHRLRQRYGLSYFMSGVNCNVGPLRAYKLAWMSLPHWLGQSFAVKTHEGPSPWGKLWMRLGIVRSAYIYRDPRDVAVSLFEHGARLRRDGMDSRTQFDQLDTLEKAIRFTARLLPIWEAWTSLPGVLLVRFEDFSADIQHEAERLESHLGLGLAEPVRRQVAGQIDPRSAEPREAARGLHLHSGRQGRWQTTMSVGQQALSQELFGPYLIAMGYGTTS